ncbi:Translin family [Musa troglodytarum]|uniref:Translin family n=1 Tax=Musa troglodytarum TaxID=320322 RepID=A0A9E7FBJ0_9LILI|nr:Translin family [Musa troglodytarum]
MRLAIGRISDGEVEYAEKICRFVRDIYRELTLLVPLMDDNFEMKKKMDTMLQSLVKIENACFSVHVRGSGIMNASSSTRPLVYVPCGMAHADEQMLEANQVGPPSWCCMVITCRLWQTVIPS